MMCLGFPSLSTTRWLLCYEKPSMWKTLRSILPTISNIQMIVHKAGRNPLILYTSFKVSSCQGIHRTSFPILEGKHSNVNQLAVRQGLGNPLLEAVLIISEFGQDKSKRY